MADQKISDLTENTTPTGDEKMYVDDGGVDKSVTIANSINARINDTTAATDKLYSSTFIQNHIDDITIHAVIIDEDDMVSDNATRVPSQQSTKAFVEAHSLDLTNPHSVTKAQVGLTEVLDIKHNITATSAPTVNNDTTEDYSAGSVWVDLNSDTGYLNVDATTAAAVWKQVTDPLISQEFISSAQVISVAGQLVLAHGLGVTPKFVTYELVNTSAELGYTLGQVVESQFGLVAGTSNEGFTIIKDATNVTLRFGSDANVLALAHATTGVATAITPASWDFFVRAYA